MTDQSDAFNQDIKPATNPSDAFADQLSTIQRDDGTPKYDSVDKALEALKHTQQHVATLESESKVLRDELANSKLELDKRASVEDVVSRLAASKGQEQTATQDNPPQSQGLDDEAVQELVQKALHQNERENALVSNLSTVNEALLNGFGEKTQEVVSSKADQLGISVDELKDLSKNKPNLVLSLFGLDKNSTPNTSVTTGSYNIPPSAVQQPELEKPSKSLLRGATSKEQLEYMKKIRSDVLRKNGIEE